MGVAGVNNQAAQKARRERLIELLQVLQAVSEPENRKAVESALVLEVLGYDPITRNALTEGS